MPKSTFRRVILTASALLVIVGCISLCSGLYYIQQRSRAEADNYNRRLQQLGIPLTLEGVENYILQSVSVGMTRDEIMQKLKPLGSVISSDLIDCEGIAIGLENVPGASTKFFVPPDQPPGYAISVCYSDGKISEVGNFRILGSYFYTAGLYDGELKPTVEARLTQTALPNP